NQECQRLPEASHREGFALAALAQGLAVCSPVGFSPAALRPALQVRPAPFPFVLLEPSLAVGCHLACRSPTIASCKAGRTGTMALISRDGCTRLVSRAI